MPRLTKSARAIAQESGLRVNGRQKSIFDDQPKSKGKAKVYVESEYIANYRRERNIRLRQLYPELINEIDELGNLIKK